MGDRMKALPRNCRLLCLLAVLSLGLAACSSAPPRRTSAPTGLQDADGETYTCHRHTFPIILAEEFAAQSARAHMLDDDTVAIDVWIYRPLRAALDQGIATPTAVPDGFVAEHLPTDYAQITLSLPSGAFTETAQLGSPFPSSICPFACRQQFLSQSPDAQWQLIVVTAAKPAELNGIWLINRDHFQRQIAPFDADSYYRPSEMWWRWQTDASGLFLSYRTTGESAEVPMYVELSRLPAYRLLLEGVSLGPGMFADRALPVDDTTILLQVAGPIIRADGSTGTQQWYVFDTRGGSLHPATPEDFARLAKYLLVDVADDPDPVLIPWNTRRQAQWLSDHPGADIWEQLGEQALFTAPHRTESGAIRMPLVDDTRAPIQVLDCAPGL